MEASSREGGGGGAASERDWTGVGRRGRSGDDRDDESEPTAQRTHTVNFLSHSNIHLRIHSLKVYLLTTFSLLTVL